MTWESMSDTTPEGKRELFEMCTLVCALVFEFFFQVFFFYHCMLSCIDNSKVERLGAKHMVMNLVNHGNAEVRMQALLAIQKMMVHNW